MPSDATLDREALRIAIGFTLALVVAEALDLQLTFIAPLVAGALLAGPPPRLMQLILLPILAAGSVAIAGFVTEALHALPVVLCLLLWGVYLAAFRLSLRPASASIGLVLLLVFAILPEVIVRAPELAPDVARWFASNFATAAACCFVMQTLLPKGPEPPGAAQPGSVLSPAGSATALLGAVLLATAFQPPAVGAALVSVVITLRPDVVTPRHVIRNRLYAAVIGGGAAVLAWQAAWLQPSLAVLAAATLVFAFLIARRIVTRDAASGIAAKSLNAFAILLGEGFSVFYDDPDERIWVRLAGVIVGVIYVAVVLLLYARRPDGWQAGLAIASGGGAVPDAAMHRP